MQIDIKVDTFIISQVIAYECGTLLFISRENYVLRMFENRVLGNVFGSKMGDLIENWRKMHGEVLHDFYCLPNVRIFRSMIMGWTGHEAGMWERRNAYIA